jgi:sugar-specific transcriptional regulator TrmB
MVSPKILEQFGLSEKEAKVYLAVLELGGASVVAIATLAGIHRVSTYDLLESLKEKGFVFDTQQDKRRIVRPMEPEQVAAAIRSKERLFSALVPELTAIRGKGEGKPRASCFEGRDGIWQALKDYFNNKIKSETLIYGSADRILSEYKIEIKREAGAAALAGAKSKNLQERKNGADKEALSEVKVFGPIKYLPEGKKISGNIFIYDNKVLTISWEQMTAVVIDDKHHAENQRCVFNLLWELLP